MTDFVHAILYTTTLLAMRPNNNYMAVLCRMPTIQYSA